MTAQSRRRRERLAEVADALGVEPNPAHGWARIADWAVDHCRCPACGALPGSDCEGRTGGPGRTWPHGKRMGVARNLRRTTRPRYQPTREERDELELINSGGRLRVDRALTEALIAAVERRYFGEPDEATVEVDPGAGDDSEPDQSAVPTRLPLQLQHAVYGNPYSLVDQA